VAAGVLGKDELEVHALSDAMGSLFPLSEGRIRPFHKSLVDWLVFSDRAGQYFVSPNKGHARLAEYGMREYRAGVNSMSLYMLAFLPEHLAKANRVEDLRALLSDRLYIERLMSTRVRKPGDLARYKEMSEPFVENNEADIMRML